LSDYRASSAMRAARFITSSVSPRDRDARQRQLLVEPASRSAL
jgi:hypothetical protein